MLNKSNKSDICKKKLWVFQMDPSGFLPRLISPRSYRNKSVYNFFEVWVE